MLRWRWAVVTSWIFLLVTAVHFLPSLSSVVQNDNAAFLPSNAPSVQAAQLVTNLAPSGQLGGLLVADSTNGPLTTSDLARTELLERQIGRLPLVASVSGGATSSDGEVKTAIVQFVPSAAGGGRLGRTAVASIRSLFPDEPELYFYLTGALPVLVDQQGAASRTESKVVLATALLILFLLLVALRALGAPLVLLAAAGLGLGVSAPVIAWSTHIGVQISSLLQLLLTALVLGAGTDYGLFLLFRYREYLADGHDHQEAIVLAMARVGKSITFSAATVIAALLSLLLASFGLYRGVGPGLAIGVAIALMVNLTFLPACLAICGPRVFWPWRPHRGVPRRGWGLVASRTVRRPAGALVAVAALLGALAVFLIAYAPSGFNTGGAIGGTNSAIGEQVVADHFGALQVSSEEVAFRLRSSVWDKPSLLDAYRADLLDTGLFTGVSGALDAGGAPVPAWWLSLAHSYLGPPQGLPAVAPGGLGPYTAWYNAYRSTAELVSANGRTIVFKVSLSAGQPTSTAAMQAVPLVRDAVHSVASELGAVRSGYIGTAAGAYDVSRISTSDMVKIVPVVLAVLALLLALLVKSLLAPVYLVASVGLSYLAALGLTVAIFVVIGGGLGVNFTLPFFMFVFVMALGQDYNILVISRIREEADHLALREAVSKAMVATGTTVTSAGLILAGTFGVLAATTSGQIRQIGVGLSLGILLDTFFVRTVLLPATVVLLGRWNWWPWPSGEPSRDQDLTSTASKARAMTP
jgi:RND superfamily putative drug exporter